MRISTTQFYEASAANYQRTYTNVVKTGQEVSSQVRINTASDDPVGAARLLQLGQQSAMLEQYKTNLGTAKLTLTQSETALGSIQNALQRAQELVISAGTGAFTDADRKANAAELDQIQSTILGLMNSQDANGQYLFGGSKTSTPPYSQNADGSYSYNGDQSSLNLPIGDSMSIASNTTGWAAFEQAINTTRTSTTMTSPAVDDGRVTLSGGQVSSNTTYNAKFAAGAPYTVTLLSSTQLQITDAAGNDVTAEASQGGKFSSVDAANQTVNFRGVDLNMNINLSDADRNSTATADTALAGHSFQFAATPDSFATARSPGNSSSAQITGTTESNSAAYSSSFPPGGAVLKFTSATTYDLYASPITSDSKPVSSGTMTGSNATAAGLTFAMSGTPAAGDQFTIQANTHQSQNILNTLGQLSAALKVPADGDPIATQKARAALDSALGNLTSASNQISTALSDSGARGRMVDDQSATNDSLSANNQTNQGTILNSDPVEAYTRLQLQQNMLQAAQLAFSMISKLNLFDKI